MTHKLAQQSQWKRHAWRRGLHSPLTSLLAASRELGAAVENAAKAKQTATTVDLKSCIVKWSEEDEYEDVGFKWRRLLNYGEPSRGFIPFGDEKVGRIGR